MFTLTSAAAQQILQTAEDSGAQNLALRIAARLGADGTVECGMGFDEPTDEDLKLDIAGVAIVIAEEHQALLDDTLLDYVELEPGEFHFIFGDQESLGSAPRSESKQGVATGGGCGGGSCGGCASKAQA
jgi:iron-sulfur cluster assembly protein